VLFGVLPARRINNMALYIVVHHPSDPYQPYANEWDPNTHLLRTIATTPKFVRDHAETLRPGKRILIHRCGWGAFPPMIWCSVEVGEVTPYFIRVADVRLMEETPPLQPMPGCDYYEHGR
jgi:hypothetical protein